MHSKHATSLQSYSLGQSKFQDGTNVQVLMGGKMKTEIVTVDDYKMYADQKENPS